jgi:hypothetical protein
MLRPEAVFVYKFSCLVVTIDGLKTLRIGMFSRLIKMTLSRIIVNTMCFFRFNGIRGIQKSSILKLLDLLRLSLAFIVCVRVKG